MPREYKIPPPEGPAPKEPSRVRVFQPNEMPVEIGSLEREALSYIGKWNIFMDKQGYGIAYRLAVKEGLKDDEGDPVTLVLHFASPIARRGLKMTPEIVQQHYEKLRQVMQIFTMQAHQSYGENILSISPEPPKWMMGELEEMLK